MGEVATVFLQHGILGTSVLVLAGVVWKLYRAYARTQDQRVTEAQAVTSKLLEVTEKWLSAIGAQNTAIGRVEGKVEGVEKRVCETLAVVQQHDRDTRKGR